MSHGESILHNTVYFWYWGNVVGWGGNVKVQNSEFKIIYGGGYTDGLGANGFECKGR